MNTRASPTTDLDKARHDLDVVGYCIVEGVAPNNLVSRARERILEQASAERDAGRAFVQDGNTQWIANVLNKGAEFLELLTCSATSLELCRHVLGQGFILSCSNAPIAGPATGANRTQDEYRISVTNNLVAPMIRPLVNYPYSLREEVVDGLDEQQRRLLGFTTWTAYGNEGVPTQELKYFKPAIDQPGPMS